MVTRHQLQVVAVCKMPGFAGTHSEAQTETWAYSVGDGIEIAEWDACRLHGLVDDAVDGLHVCFLRQAGHDATPALVNIFLSG